ncbi:maleylpyruvate isomerase family mycothiol-dependent enzyme [Mycolicibacterium sp. 3033]|uniref:maleylpyruvate isomerase family mycothiol-dependent enzyme n=1 Tax=Mycolicibacterium sp. S3B2 TaxID=3415120 RepID=UPI001C850249|nr:maleylpyruvate isomerase family mycothiol-dependent enzyme [Mycolicibacterium aurantiacum]
MNSTDRPVTVLPKAEVLSGLFAVWADLEKLLADLSDSQWKTATALPGWTVQDVVSHIIGTESFLQGLPAPDIDIDVSALGHVRNEIGAMNESWVHSMRAHSPEQMRDELKAILQARRAALEDMSEQVWNEVTFTPAGPDSYGRFMRIRIFDCWMHEHDIRDAIGTPASDRELATTTARLSLDEMAGSMGFVVGKRAGAPDGSRVAIELTGPLQRTIKVQVDGRAKVVEDFGGADPTTTITIDGLLFTRLAGGRTPAAEHEADIEFDGDDTVGRRVVENLNYVI